MLSSIRSSLPKPFQRRASTQGLSVLCYHGVVDLRANRLDRNFHLISDFQTHVNFLRQGRVVGLAEVADHLRCPKSSERPAVAFTFDDGYINNLAAAEILSVANLPCTIFVTTAAVGKGLAIWTVELSLLMLHGRAERIEAFGKCWRLETQADREEAFQAVRYPLKTLPSKLRLEAMNGIRAQYPANETGRLLEVFPEFQMLDWKQIRQLAEAGVEIGSHGVDHEIHHSSQTSEVRRRELVESKMEIENQLGKPCRFFAFPNGDFCEESAKEVEESGYALAFTTRPGNIRDGANPFLLPRISPPGDIHKLKRQLREPGL